jgi:hypothetical protein
MYKLKKKIERYLRVNLLEPGPRLMKKVNVYLPSLRMKVPDHVYVFGSLPLQ